MNKFLSLLLFFWACGPGLNMVMIMSPEEEKILEESIADLRKSSKKVKPKFANRIIEREKKVDYSFQTAYPAPENGTWSSAFSDETKQQSIEVSSADWMKFIPDEKKLSEFNIAGTHDSTAFMMTNKAKKYAQCQEMKIWRQLHAGVRNLDIRLVYDKKENNLFCCHGKGAVQCDCYFEPNEQTGHGERTRISYYHVLDNVVRFLTEHPTETIILAPKYESGNKHLTIFYMNLIHLMLQAKNPNVIYLEDRVPTLGEVRGKIVIWDKKGHLKHGIKILTDISQKYHQGTKWFIHKEFNLKNGKTKVKLIKTAFKRAETFHKKKGKDNVGFITFTSGFTGLPNLPQPGKIAEVVNPFLLKYKFVPGCLYGWIITDFATKELVQKIVMTNFTSEGQETKAQAAANKRYLQSKAS